MNLKELIKHRKAQGFTLIELLVVIAILGVLVVGLIIAIDPTDKVKAASDARVFSDFGGIARATEAYATNNKQMYPSAISDLVAAGELKAAPIPPSGYTYSAVNWTGTPPTVAASCIAGHLASPTCTGISYVAQIFSKGSLAKVGGGAVTGYYRYDSPSGKTCFVATATTTCP